MRRKYVILSPFHFLSLLANPRSKHSLTYAIERELQMTNIGQLQFGDLQVELTPEKAYIGAAIGLVFG